MAFKKAEIVPIKKLRDAYSIYALHLFYPAKSVNKTAADE